MQFNSAIITEPSAVARDARGTVGVLSGREGGLAPALPFAALILKKN